MVLLYIIVNVLLYPGDRNDTITCLPATTTTDTSNVTDVYRLQEWAIGLICVLGVIILALIIIIMVVVYKLCHLTRYDSAHII